MMVADEVVDLFREDFRKLKLLSEKAMIQLEDHQLFLKPQAESNSIAVIVQHMSGNMVSRWTDFYTTDGEKPDRKRDHEFEERKMTRSELMELWERGWTVFLQVMDEMKGTDLEKLVHIRKEPHTVLKAVIRQHSHYSYHTGQIVQLAKQIKGEGFTSLSIPRNESEKFNASFK